MSSTERTALTGTPPAPYFVDKRRNTLKESSGVEMKQLGGGSGGLNVREDDDGDEYDESYGGFSQQLADISSWLRSLTSSYTSIAAGGSSSAKPRKVPVKVEPKVFFANERTFLAWMHMSVTLASISVAIVAFAEANKWSQLYGLLLMPCAIAFCGYSLWMYIKRAGMIRRKDPGPYEDLAGPIVLSAMLGMSIVVNFFVKVYEYST